MKSEVLFVLFARLFIVRCQPVDEQCVHFLQELGAIKVDQDGPVGFYDAKYLCLDRNLIVLAYFEKLNEEEKSLCDNQLVPFISHLEEPEQGIDMTFPAANLTSGQLQRVPENYNFSCVLCQRWTDGFPRSTTSIVLDDWISSVRFKLHLKAVNSTVRGILSTDYETNPNLPIGKVFNLIEWIDSDQRQNVEYWIRKHISTSASIAEVETSVFNDTFLMQVEDVDFCPEGDAVDSDGVVTHWLRTNLTGEDHNYQYVTNVSSGAITRRDCLFDDSVFHGNWDPRLTRWGLVWTSCTADQKFSSELYYTEFLNASDITRRHAEVLHNFTTTTLEIISLQEVAHFINLEIDARNEVPEQMVRDLVVIMANVNLSLEFFVVSEEYASLVVAKRKGNEPVEGFTYDFDPFNIKSFKNITANRKLTVQGRAEFALDVSGRILEAHTRVAFAIARRSVRLISSVGGFFFPSYYTDVTVMLPVRDEVSAWSFASYANHHVRITYNESATTYDEDVTSSTYFFSCVAWNYGLRDWSSQGCAILYTNQSGFGACRCSGKYFVMQDGAPIGRFALKKSLAANKTVFINSPFTDFLKDKPGLMTVTAIECLLSLLGLGSIIATAILFKQWRENMGHKILLHMVMALTCNLVLGFVSSFTSMTTDGVGCLIYGVLRHYSFLAMFFWMLVLSFLQMKRLTTVAGAKATSHLILKVSVFAWGVPLLPIIFLLSYDYGFYQTDRFDRGYCYPEGIVLQVTVQGPAGLILLINSVIFVRIVAKIFGFWDKNKITRHSKNERAEQLNKLKTSLFMFVLFGFSWVFHIFSEERVIVSDFLFEYLFLITATTHIFVLFLFFVVFQESTRKGWVQLIGCK